jgi:hypothetical protein
MQKILKIFLNAIPILFMVALIPLVKDDYPLTLFYVIIIIIALSIKRENNEYMIFIFGFIIMIIFEYFFISTGVEVFNRHSLFNIMPMWLPFLWGYGFIAIKRSVEILKYY